MTAKTTREYMTKMKLRYARAKHRSERSALIDEAVTMTGFSRKYVIRLLCGSRVYKNIVVVLQRIQKMHVIVLLKFGSLLDRCVVDIYIR